MHHLLEGRAFSGDFHKLEALLSRIAWLLNYRPITVRSLAALASPDVAQGRLAGGALEKQEEALTAPGAV